MKLFCKTKPDEGKRSGQIKDKLSGHDATTLGGASSGKSSSKAAAAAVGTGERKSLLSHVVSSFFTFFNSLSETADILRAGLRAVTFRLFAENPGNCSGNALKLLLVDCLATETFKFRNLSRVCVECSSPRDARLR